MRVLKEGSKSMIMEEIEKVDLKLDTEKSDDSKFSPVQSSFDLGALGRADASFIAFAEDRIDNFMSADISMLNDEEKTPSFSMCKPKSSEIALSIQQNTSIQCLPKTKAKSNRNQILGISVALGVLGLMFLTKKTR